MKGSIKRSESCRTNQGSNFLRDTFSKRECAGDPIQFRRNNINSIIVTETVEPLSTLVPCLVGQIQVQKPTLAIDTNQKLEGPVKNKINIGRHSRLVVVNCGLDFCANGINSRVALVIKIFFFR